MYSYSDPDELAKTTRNNKIIKYGIKTSKFTEKNPGFKWAIKNGGANLCLTKEERDFAIKLHKDKRDSELPEYFKKIRDTYGNGTNSDKSGKKFVKAKQKKQTKPKKKPTIHTQSGLKQKKKMEDCKSRRINTTEYNRLQKDFPDIFFSKFAVLEKGKNKGGKGNYEKNLVKTRLYEGLCLTHQEIEALKSLTAQEKAKKVEQLKNKQSVMKPKQTNKKRCKPIEVTKKNMKNFKKIILIRRCSTN